LLHNTVVGNHDGIIKREIVAQGIGVHRTSQRKQQQSLRFGLSKPG